MNLIENEQFKLTANWLNALSAACFIAGVIAPLAAVRSIELVGLPEVGAIAFSVIWLLSGGLLHIIARTVLEELVG